MKIKKHHFVSKKGKPLRINWLEKCALKHIANTDVKFSPVWILPIAYIEEVWLVWLPILHNMGIFADPLCQKPTFFNKIGLNVKKLTNSFFYALCSDKKCKQSAARFLTRLVFIYFNIWLSNLMLQLEFSTHFTYGRSANIKCNLNSLLPVQR